MVLIKMHIHIFLPLLATYPRVSASRNLKLPRLSLLKKKKKSKLRFNFGPIMTIKLMPAFFFPAVFLHLAALKTNYQLKRDVKWSRTSDLKTLLNTSAASIREASQSKN